MIRVAERGGVIGLGAALLSTERAKATADGFVDQLKHTVDLVGIGFDFCKFLIDQRPAMTLPAIDVFFPPDLSDHSHMSNVTRIMIERGFGDGDMEKVLHGNWMRLLGEHL